MAILCRVIIHKAVAAFVFEPERGIPFFYTPQGINKKRSRDVIPAPGMKLYILCLLRLLAQYDIDTAIHISLAAIAVDHLVQREAVVQT